MIVSRQTLPEW